ncbi:MAG: alkaline phosphatase family protein [Vicinamibacterales bacterium]
MRATASASRDRDRVITPPREPWIAPSLPRAPGGRSRPCRRSTLRDSIRRRVPALPDDRGPRRPRPGARIARPQAPPGGPPPLIVIGIDGFRHDYLERAQVPVLRGLAARGARAGGFIPPFPSKTFPSFLTIATGLLPVHHGILNNTMDDPAIPVRFRLSDHDGRSDPRWWLGEPLWVTAERQGTGGRDVLAATTSRFSASGRPTGGRSTRPCRTTRAWTWCSSGCHGRPPGGPDS